MATRPSPLPEWFLIVVKSINNTPWYVLLLAQILWKRAGERTRNKIGYGLAMFALFGGLLTPTLIGLHWGMLEAMLGAVSTLFVIFIKVEDASGQGFTLLQFVEHRIGEKFKILSSYWKADGQQHSP
jgi:hypothetical protein